MKHALLGNNRILSLSSFILDVFCYRGEGTLGGDFSGSFRTVFSRNQFFLCVTNAWARLSLFNEFILFSMLKITLPCTLYFIPNKI